MKKEVRRLDYGDRRKIQDMLDARERLVDIAREVTADPTSVSREIKRNRTPLGKVAKSRFRIVTCDRFEGCEVRGLCGSWCSSRCRSCSDVRCEAACGSFREFSCRATERFPHVCNGCRLLNRCPKERYSYRARDAHRAATERLRESRRGIDLDLASATAIAEVVGPLLAKGQSVPAILSSHPELKMSPTTLYHYVDLGLVAGATNLLMPRKVRFKKRSRKASAPPDRQRRDLTGRDYAAFLLLDPEVRARFKEMDTVIGRPGGKCLLTFCMRENEIFYARLMDSKEADSARDALDGIEMDAVDGGVAGELGLMCVLTDRGPEFDRFEDLERSVFAPHLGERRIEVYYCDPYCSWQKPHVENAHTLLRRVLPKGTSFDGLTQADVDLICSHINSYPRAELGWRSPFEMLPEWGQENLPPAFGMRVVPRDEVNLTPSLVGM